MTGELLINGMSECVVQLNLTVNQAAGQPGQQKKQATEQAALCLAVLPAAPQQSRQAEQNTR